MPKINSILITLEGDKQVYRPGDWVKGHWTIDVGEAFSVRGVRLALKGAAYTRWNDDAKKDDKIGYESFTSQWRTVFGTKLGEQSSGSHTYPVDKHVHKFSFRLPTGRLPSSYEGNHGAIRYWLYLEIDRPIFRFNITRLKTITVLDDIDVNAQIFAKFVGRVTEKKVCTALLVGDEGNVKLHAQTDRGAYCPGEKIAISLVANNGTNRDLGVVKATLTQKINFVANGEEKIKTIPLQSVTGASLKKQEKRNWTNQALTVPAVPPTTTERTCHIVTVTYYVKVLVDIPVIHGGDIYVIIPVTIGTIPQGHSPRSGGASNTFEIDASKTITHAQCSRGYDQFSKGDSRFPTTSYIPWCAYVPNFKFPTTTAAKPAAKPTQTPKPAKQLTPQTAPVNRAPPRPIPSAPSIDLAPPSYEDVMKQIADEKAEQTTTNMSEPDTDTETEPPSEITQMPQKACKGLLVLRFPDKVLNNFRKALTDSAELLKKHNGHALALSSQVIVNSGSWHSRTSIALLVFLSQGDGKQWVSQSDDIFKSNGVEFQDIVLMNTHEQFQNEKSLFNCGILMVKPGYTAARAKEYSAMSRRLMTPLRVENGGIIVCVTKMNEHLIGSWPSTGEVLSLSQWDSLTQLGQYRAELQKDRYKEVMGLFRELYDRTMSVTFQTEDLSFVQDITDSISDSEHSHVQPEEKVECDPNEKDVIEKKEANSKEQKEE